MLVIVFGLFPVQIVHGYISNQNVAEQEEPAQNEIRDSFSNHSSTVLEVLKTLLSGSDAELKNRILNEPVSLDVEYRVGRELESALENYFDPKKFLVDIRTDIVKSVYSVDVPVVQEWEESRKADADLPGLPFVPEVYLKDISVEKEETSINEREVQFLEIEKFEITLYVDSLFNVEDLDLMRQIVSSKVRLDDARGDNFDIVQQRFTIEDTDEITSRTAISSYVYGALLMLLLLLLLLFIWYFFRNYKEKGSSE